MAAVSRLGGEFLSVRSIGSLAFVLSVMAAFATNAPQAAAVPVPIEVIVAFAPPPSAAPLTLTGAARTFLDINESADNTSNNGALISTIFYANSIGG